MTRKGIPFEPFNNGKVGKGKETKQVSKCS